MGKLRSIRGGRKTSYSTQLLARESGWEIRQVYDSIGDLSGDLLILYTPAQVRAVVLLRKVPLDSEWETLDTWVLTQLDNYERRFVVDYYEARYVTGVEGPPERPSDDEEESE